jgi:hypothetical protein
VTGAPELVPPSDTPRAIINKAFADRFFAGKDPIGATFAWGYPLVNFNTLYQVIGVVETIQYWSLIDGGGAMWYVPINIFPRRFVVSTSLPDPTPLIPTVRSALTQVDSNVMVNIQPYREIQRAAMWRHQLGLLLMVIFAVSSLALAAIGIFGVIAHATGQRTRELATRMALGATPRNIAAVLMAQGRTLSLIGGIAGAAAAYTGGRMAASQLYEVRAGDPTILIVAVVAVLLVTFVAFLVPALRAARIAPGEALKLE